jgi:hypothetical protein
MTACQAVIVVIYYCFSTFTTATVVAGIPDSNTQTIDVALLLLSRSSGCLGEVHLLHR